LLVAVAAAAAAAAAVVVVVVVVVAGVVVIIITENEKQDADTARELSQIQLLEATNAEIRSRLKTAKLTT
jgi:hypothetical protein